MNSDQVLAKKKCNENELEETKSCYGSIRGLRNDQTAISDLLGINFETICYGFVGI
jgi:hypothetical protein